MALHPPPPATATPIPTHSTDYETTHFRSEPNYLHLKEHCRDHPLDFDAPELGSEHEATHNDYEEEYKDDANEVQMDDAGRYMAEEEYMQSDGRIDCDVMEEDVRWERHGDGHGDILANGVNGEPSASHTMVVDDTHTISINDTGRHMQQRDGAIRNQQNDQEKEKQSEDNVKARLLINPNKAGTQHVDKERIQEIIYEASKGTPFFLDQQRRDALLTSKITHYTRLATHIRSLPSLTREQSYIASYTSTLLSAAALQPPRTIVCVDMDAFYASVEELDQPHLKHLPMAVGSIGMLTTANYEARKYGVRSAMPGYIARKLCPRLVIVKPSFEKYTRVSTVVRQVFAKYDPHFVSMSLDEATLDLTPYLTAHPTQTPSEIVQQLRTDIFTTTGLTASAGIAPTKPLAKVCSDLNKPNGQYVLTPAAVPAFVESLQIRKVPGIGRVNERILNALGIRTCGEMRRELVLIYKLFSPIFFAFCARTALGLPPSPAPSDGENAGERKSIGVERTFAPIATREEMYAKIGHLASLLEEDLRQANRKGLRVTLKLKSADFRSWSRAKTLERFVWKRGDIERVARGLLDREWEAMMKGGGGMKLRLMGLSMSKLAVRSLHPGPAESSPHGADEQAEGREGDEEQGESGVINRAVGRTTAGFFAPIIRDADAERKREREFGIVKFLVLDSEVDPHGGPAARHGDPDDDHDDDDAAENTTRNKKRKLDADENGDSATHPTCPVCGKVFLFRGLSNGKGMEAPDGVEKGDEAAERAMNEHVGRCLDESLGNPNHTHDPPLNPDNLDPVPPATNPSATAAANQPERTGIRKWVVSTPAAPTSNTSPATPSQQSGNEATSTCPVCAHPFPDPRNLAAVNAHLDRCLSAYT